MGKAIFAYWKNTLFWNYFLGEIAEKDILKKLHLYLAT